MRTEDELELRTLSSSGRFVRNMAAGGEVELSILGKNKAAAHDLHVTHVSKCGLKLNKS